MSRVSGSGQAGVLLTNHLFGTTPIILHFPGESGRSTCLWSMRKSILRNLQPPKSPLRTDLEVVTVADSTSQILFDVMHSLDLPLTVLDASGRPWDYLLKPILLLEYLSRTTSRYILFLDAADVIVLGDINIIVDYLESLNAQCLFNATIHVATFNAEDASCEMSRHQPPPFQHLNSGVFIAKVDFLKYFLEQVFSIYESAKRDGQVSADAGEQTWFRKIHNQLYPASQLDNRCEMFQVVKTQIEHLISCNISDS